jgi:outer membrane protein OmpA-like peptidoglycan-associated protein
LARLVGLALGVGALAAEASRAAQEDHPLVSRYPQSKLDKREVKDFTSYQLVTGLEAKDMSFQGKAIEGTVTRIVYTNPSDRSTLEIFRNYRQALADAGGKILYECELDACGKAYARSAWNRFNGLFAASDGDPRYLAAQVTKGDVHAFVALMVGKQRTQLDVIEVKAMDTGLVAVDADALAKDIAKAGSVRVYGILFDLDKADIRPESKPTLEAIAGLLKQQPGLSLFVVGHTDSSGEFEHNMTLSAARARAVATAITRDHGIAAARLAAHGVGPLAPVAPNTTDDGRQLNRRVELVAR